MHRPKVAHVTTIPMSLHFLEGQPAALRAAGFDVSAISSPGIDLDAFGRREGVPTHAVPMTRSISPMRDLKSLLHLYRVLREVKPDILHAHTPKAGLLGMVAGTVAGVPARIYQVHGLPLETASGLRKLALWGSDRVACALAHRVLPVSPSLKEALEKSRLVPRPHAVGRTFRPLRKSKVKVLAGGSVNGVDANGTFDPARSAASRSSIRSAWNVPPNAAVIGFVGRLVREKGVVELAEAWTLLRGMHPDAYLVLIGPSGAEDPLPEQVLQALRNDDRVRLLGEDWNVAPLMAAMDVVALPTWREGLGMVLLEAAAMALPTVASRVTGCVDAVEDGITGTLVPPRDPQALVAALRRYLTSPELRRAHGDAGRSRVLQKFDRRVVSDALVEEYRSLLRPPSAQRRFSRHLKATVDRAAAAAALVALSPVMIGTAAAVRVGLGSPVLFRQKRPGLHGRPFEVWKFRTMRNAVDAQGRPLPDAERLTRLGKFLRAASLDELPQLWNVVKGDLSLVGPRPLLMQYLERYTPRQARRHEVKPGITGWAQVHGRNALSWEERFEHDVWYVDNWSLLLDAKILLMTVRQVLKRSGVSQPGHVTMSEFMGSP